MPKVSAKSMALPPSGDLIYILSVRMANGFHLPCTMSFLFKIFLRIGIPHRITNSPTSETTVNKVRERSIKRNTIVIKYKTLDVTSKHRGFKEETKCTIDYCCIGVCGGIVGFFFPKIPYPISPPSIEKIGYRIKA